jgi:D-alanine--poly(phosphoribitol) ligase subunit 1
LISASDFESQDGLPPLGDVITNFNYSVLNEDQKPVDEGDIGELYLGGPCVGLGYFNQEAETKRAFVQSPINPCFLEKVYRTGDLVRLSPEDKKLYFMGRGDSQIKHMGYRIELDEIQHALVSIAGVNEAAVLHSNKNGNSSIIAVISTKSDLNAVDIKKQVAERVPRYMVPEKVYIREVLPKNPNGKVDRQLLKSEYT